MTPSLYLTCFAIAFVGLLISVLMQLKSQNDKAKAANLIPHGPIEFIKTEWISLSISVLVIVVGLIFIPIIVGWKPAYLPFVKPAFLPIGYQGTDMLLKALGVVNSRYNAAIKAKSDQADLANGTSAAPTPATKPQV
jgi:archaellum biogenesis protein FlaJ (TadC family)